MRVLDDRAVYDEEKNCAVEAFALGRRARRGCAQEGDANRRIPARRRRRMSIEARDHDTLPREAGELTSNASIVASCRSVHVVVGRHLN